MKIKDMEDSSSFAEAKKSDIVAENERLKREKHRLQEKTDLLAKEMEEVVQSNMKVFRMKHENFERMEQERQDEHQRVVNEYEDMITKNKLTHEEELRRLKALHKKETETSLKRYEEERARLIADHKKELERVEINNLQLTTADRERFKREKDTLQRELERVQMEQNALLGTLDIETQENLSKMKIEYENEIASLKYNLDTLATEKEKELEDLRNLKQEEISTLKQRHQDEMKRERDRSESEKQNAQESLRFVKDKEINDLTTKIERLKESHRKDLADKEEEFRKQLRQVDLNTEQLEERYNRSLRDRDIEIADLKDEIQTWQEKQARDLREYEDKVERLKREHDMDLARVKREFEQQSQNEKDLFFDDQKRWNLTVSERDLSIRSLKADMQQMEDNHNLEITDLHRTIDQLQNRVTEITEDSRKRDEMLRQEHLAEIKEKDAAIKKLREDMQMLVQRYEEVSGKSSEAVSTLHADIARLTGTIEAKDEEVDRLRKEHSQKIDDLRMRHDEDMRRRISEKQLQIDNLQIRTSNLEKERIEFRNKVDKEKGELQSKIDRLNIQLQSMGTTLSESDFPKIEFFLQESTQVLELLKQAAAKTREIKVGLRGDAVVPSSTLRAYVSETLNSLRDCGNHLEKTLATVASGSQRHHLGIRVLGGSDSDAQERLARLQESYKRFWQELDSDA
eukprot:TRINITY_DN7166_c0_g1_i2.p2 TRINITY_DN7166_c0_g1~~TRINITY_DN7166_c0_g1_i2.p2  ORF type:complete len:685 (-),score=217.19 TRINITY_DN7166_c0_g1_i2:105-2159(-)